MSRLILPLLAAVLLAAGLATPAEAGPGLRGVQLHSLWDDLPLRDMDRELDLAAATGANLVRVDVAWGSLETAGRGRIEESYRRRLDHFVAGAAARGMKVLATLWSTPCWASTAPADVLQDCRGAWWDRGVGAYPPRNPGDYGRITRWLTGRYGTRLAALEVWNEPNLPDGTRFWNTPRRVADYVALVRAGFLGARRGDPAVPVIAGALAFADSAFLEHLYAAGLRRYEDGISVHSYNEWRAPADPWQPQWQKYTFLPGLDAIHRTMQAAGDRGQVWVTEFGWTTDQGDPWGVTPERQAAYVAEGFALLAGMPFVAEASVYNLVATSDDPGSFEGGFGLLDADYTPRPAYAAITAALHGSGLPRR